MGKAEEKGNAAAQEIAGRAMNECEAMEKTAQGKMDQAVAIILGRIVNG